jgi:hypothetical protein
MPAPAKFGFAAAVILASTLGFSSLTHAAPFAGVTDPVIAVQRTQRAAETDGLIQKARHHGYAHKGKMKTEMHHHHHHYHIHHHHHHHHHGQHAT